MLNQISSPNFNTFMQNKYQNNRANTNLVAFKSNSEPERKDKTVFIAMPMPNKPYTERKKWNDVNKQIQSIAAGQNIKAQRIDDILSNNPDKLDIQHSILEGIRNSDAVIADLSEPNPNVYFEMGYALGCKKKIYPIAKEGTILPFDVRNIFTTFYANRKADLDLKLTDLLTKISKLNTDKT